MKIYKKKAIMMKIKMVRALITLLMKIEVPTFEQFKECGIANQNIQNMRKRSVYFAEKWPRLSWLGLVWVKLGWPGLGWSFMEWVALGWVGLD